MGHVVTAKCKPCNGNPDGLVLVEEAWYLAHKEDYLGLVSEVAPVTPSPAKDKDIAKPDEEKGIPREHAVKGHRGK
jgi:hypothetical protein